jgi:hypothetical protein
MESTYAAHITPGGLRLLAQLRLLRHGKFIAVSATIAPEGRTTPRSTTPWYSPPSSSEGQAVDYDPARGPRVLSV